MKAGKLILIPNVISPNTQKQAIPQGVIAQIMPLRCFVTENLRTARRYLRSIGYSANFDTEVQFFELNKHTDLKEIPEFIQPLLQGTDVGVLSESGVPCVADPGALVVEQVQKLGLQVVPLVGPSSILLALMASGFNGQNFAFNGYLPIQDKDRRNKLRDLEQRILREDQTQIFIEAPYRNTKLFEAILHNCRNDMKLCVAIDVNGAKEKIVTRSIGEWKADKPMVNKVNTIFLLYK
jgi:16S rRNA (cytidine1402-2'-O)-methyltransferase